MLTGLCEHSAVKERDDDTLILICDLCYNGSLEVEILYEKEE